MWVIGRGGGTDDGAIAWIRIWTRVIQRTIRVPAVPVIALASWAIVVESGPTGVIWKD